MRIFPFEGDLLSFVGDKVLPFIRDSNLMLLLFKGLSHQALNRTAVFRYAHLSPFSPQEPAEEAGAMI